MCDNLGVSGGEPTVYQPIGADSGSIKDIFLAIGGAGCIYPIHDTGVEYTADGDHLWSFTFQNQGADVGASSAIDLVSILFYVKTWRGHTIKCYFKTGGVKYYVGDQTDDHLYGPPDYLQYGNRSSTATPTPGNGIVYWNVNPSTGLPWTVAQILAGEFGFETVGATVDKTIVLGGAAVIIHWGYGTTPGSGAGGGSAAAPCGQTATLPDAFTNYEASILQVTPNNGPLSGGTAVEIRGFSFVSGSTIQIGGNPATSVQFIDDQHYSCVTPAHAIGWADVVITEPSGASIILRNGFQYTLFTRGEDFRRLPGIVIKKVLNSSPSTASFTIDGESNVPRVGEKINIIDELTTPKRLLFAGNVQQVVQDYEGKTNQIVWNVSATDFTWLMNRRRPHGSYVQVSASEIVKDLIQRFAPGFTTNHVQTNLAKISFFTDGTLDLVTCLSIIARMIGGGHWDVDDTQDVHFFHRVPAIVNVAGLPAADTTGGLETAAIIRTGPGSAMTATQGGLIPGTFSYGPGFYTFQSTFLYSNGIESALSPASAPAALDGKHVITLSNIPIGAAAGSLTVIRRRIYVTYWGPDGGGQMIRFCTVNDNSTTGFTTWFGPTGADNVNVLALTTTSLPPRPAVIQPVYLATPQQAPQAATTSTAALTMQPEYRPADSNVALSWTPGNWRFKITNIYQDLTESLPGPTSNPIALSGNELVRLSGVPLGTAVNGVPVIARRVYGSMTDGDAGFASWWVIPNNAATAADIAPVTGGAQVSTPPVPGASTPSPDQPTSVWPNSDGPSLEDFDLPDDVTDDNPDLLRDPRFTSEVDLSQVRNRIFVRGSGSILVTAVTSLTTTRLNVAECGFYSPTGGQIFIEGAVLTYTGITATAGPGDLILAEPVPEQFHAGATVNLYLQLDDKKAQDELGRIELDHNGNPTDGVHEYTIVDGSLETSFQMFMRGSAELELFARPITTVRYATRDPKTRPGALVNVNLTNPPCVGEFLIQEVTIDQVQDEGDILTPRYTVMASSSKFDLNDLFYEMTSTGIGQSAGASNVSPSGIPAATIDALPSFEDQNATNMRTDLVPNLGSAAEPVLVHQGWSGTVITGGSGVTDDRGYWFRVEPTSTGEGGETARIDIPNQNTFRSDQGWTQSWVIRIPGGNNFKNGVFMGVLHMALFVDGFYPSFYDGPANGNVRSINAGAKFIGVRCDARGWAIWIGDGISCFDSSVGFHSVEPDSVYGVGLTVTHLPQENLSVPRGPDGTIILVLGKITAPGEPLSFAKPTSAFLPASLVNELLKGRVKMYNGEPGTTTTKTFDWKTIYGFR